METRERILDCAMAELERSGAAAFSLRAVGADAGVTPMAVYRHFRDRDALLTAVGEAAFAEWQRRIEAIGARPPLDWLRAASRAYIEFALDAPAKFEACFVIRTSVERRYPVDFAAGRSPVIARVVEQIEAAQHDGDLPVGDSLECAMFYWAELHGLAMLHRSGRFSLKRRAFMALADRAVGRLLSSA
jgi:AcrR family transcriptional regulator